MSEDKMIGIYKIENKVNGKVYVGQSINIDQRWYNHRMELRRNGHHNEHLQYAWNKYGEDNFSFIIIEECSLFNIDEREIFWIEEFNTVNPDYGYNITTGGQGGHGTKRTQEQKEFLSQIRNPKAVLQLDLNGNIVERWRSGSYAARETGFSVSAIMNCVKDDGDQYQAYGYIWVYEEKYYNENFNITNYIDEHFKESKRIFEYDLYGSYIKTWNCLSDIGALYGFKSNTYKEVIGVLKHKRRSVNGRIFLYEDDTFELTEEYLRAVRVKSGKYKINQFDLQNNFIKNWTIDELKKTTYRFDTIRKCCTNNLLGHKIVSKAFSYIWKYE